MAKYLDQNGAQRLVDNLKTSQSALNTKINGEIVARENFATNAASSISALDTKIDNATADMIQTIAVDGTTLSITSGAGTTDTYQVQDTTYDIATTTNAGLMSASDKAKLNNLASITSAGNNVTISGGKISAANTTYTAGANITISGTTISGTANTTYSAATTTTSGLMSASDKTKLNGIAANANNYTLPTATTSTLGGVKVGSGISVSNGVISVPTVTSSANGLMSSTDKKKLDNLASITSAGANITISGGTISAAGSNYTLPTASTTQKGGVIIGDGLAINGDTLSANVMTGATSNTAGGASGLVPAPAAGDQTKFLRGDGTWSNEIVLPTVASSLAGSLWREVNNGVPVIKYTYGNAVYSLLSANIAAVAGVPAIGTALNDWTWEQISAVSLAGLGDVYFDIGDCKEITLNGKIGDHLTLDNEKLSVFILHFNYPINGKPDNNIIWGGFKTADGTDVALCDGKYGAYPLTDGTICFTMNHWGNVNYGGWKGADLRYDILGATSTQPNDYGKEHTTANVGYDATAATLTNPKADTLLAALPSDVRNALRLWSRWIDAKGDTSNIEANIEETIDAVTLLAEFEIYGARTYANEYEQNHQTQMDYYRLGNSTFKYNHASTSSPVIWFFASPYYNSNHNFCSTAYIGQAFFANVCSTSAIAPAFMT